MSTVTIVRKNNQIAICADSLTKYGSEKNSAKYIVNHQKIIKINDSFLAITGPQSGHIALKDYFNKELQNKDHAVDFSSIEAIFQTWLKLHQSLKEDYHLNPDKNEEEAQFESCAMDILIANQHGAFGVSAFRDIQEFTKFYAYGNGNEYALGAMFTKFDDPNLTAADIAQIGVTAAAEFNDTTGLPLECHVVTLY